MDLYNIVVDLEDQKYNIFPGGLHSISIPISISLLNQKHMIYLVDQR